MCCFKPVSFGVTCYAPLVTDTRRNRAKQQGLSAPWLGFLLWALMTEGAPGPGVGGWVLGISFQQKDSSSCGHGAIYVPPAPPQPLLGACGLKIRSTCPSKACGPWLCGLFPLPPATPATAPTPDPAHSPLTLGLSLVPGQGQPPRDGTPLLMLFPQPGSYSLS